MEPHTQKRTIRDRPPSRLPLVAAQRGSDGRAPILSVRIGIYTALLSAPQVGVVLKNTGLDGLPAAPRTPLRRKHRKRPARRLLRPFLRLGTLLLSHEASILALLPLLDRKLTAVSCSTCCGTTVDVLQLLLLAVRLAAEVVELFYVALPRRDLHLSPPLRLLSAPLRVRLEHDAHA